MLFIDKNLQLFSGSELNKIPAVKKWRLLFYISVTLNILLILYIIQNTPILLLTLWLRKLASPLGSIYISHLRNSMVEIHQI